MRMFGEDTKQKQIYVAGPMSGHPNFNFPAFFAAQKKLEKLGWKVWNPAAKDMEDDPSIINNPTGDAQKAIAEGFDFREAFSWDCEKIVRGDAIYMLKGWEQSPGAKAEHAIAIVMQKHYPDYRILYE